MNPHTQTRKPTVDMPDGLLAQIALNGQQEAFEILVRRYQTPIFHFIHRLLNDYDQACDVSQQVFLRFYLSLATLETNEPFKPWLFQVAHNCCIDEIRRCRRKNAIPFSQLEPEGSESEDTFLDSITDPHLLPEQLAEQHDIQQLLQRAIAALPVKFRAVVMLRYVAMLRFGEIGRVLNMPEGTAKTYFSRSKILLKKYLQMQDQDDLLLLGLKETQQERDFSLSH